MNETFVLVFLRNRRRSYFERINVKHVRDNKIFWKNFAPLFSNKIKSKERIKLRKENENIISNDKEVAETFREFFSNVVKSLNISQNHILFLEHLKLIQSSNPLQNFPNILV